jgi:hypothetical protein
MKRARIFMMIAAIISINMSVGCAPDAGQKELGKKEASADGGKVGRYVVLNVSKPIRVSHDNSDPKNDKILIKVDTASGDIWQWMELIDIENRMHAGRWVLMQDFANPLNVHDDKK